MQKIYKIFKIIQDSLSNFFSPKKLFFISESADWVINWISYYLVKNLNSKIGCKLTITANFLKNKIIHFNSVNTFVNQKGIKKVHQSNTVILTWFHLSPDDKRIKYIKELNKTVDLVHTSCETTKKELIKYGLDKNKIIVIPLGIDLKVFRQYSQVKKDKLKRELKIPKNRIIIGSFQKDGDGWREGLEPKLIKGPDIFCDCIEKLAKKYDIHILLTGPARGYIKKRLKQANIKYTHKYLDNYLDIVKYYNCLDLYLVTARVEGGPKAILESWATGVPVVSTKVGMPLDIVKNNENGILVDVEDVGAIASGAIKILENKEFEGNLIKNGLDSVKNFDWSIVSKKYYEEIYKKWIKN